MRTLIAAGLLFLSLAACSSQLVAISGTPDAGYVMTNARKVARGLDSYRATRTTVETTVFPGKEAFNHSQTYSQDIEVASESVFRSASKAYDYEYIRTDGTSYSRSNSGHWDVSTAGDDPDEYLLPGEKPLPPAHPMEWLSSRNVLGAKYIGLDLVNGTEVYVVAGVIPMLPGPLSADDRVPADDVRIYIDAATFHVLRIEIDHNIRDSLREDSGYQVIPGIVEIETFEIIEYSDHNAVIEIEPPILASAT